MSEARSQEIGPIVAIAMIVLGLGAVGWAVGTKEQTAAEKPGFNFTTNVGSPSGETEQEPEEEEGISDAEWEKVLIDVEKMKTEGVVTKIDVSTQVVHVSSEKWKALDEARQKEIGRHLAVYVGRVSGSDRHEVEIRDDADGAVGTYRRD